MARISQLAGQINRHKNQQAGLYPSHSGRPVSHHRMFSTPSSTGSSGVEKFEDTGYSGSRHRGGYPYGGYSSPRMPAHRHRTLILNGASQPNKPSDVDSGAASDASSGSWVSRSDRHLQIINSSVYEKESQARARAIEQTRRQKQALKDDREKAKLINHLNRIRNSTTFGTANPHAESSPNKYEVSIQGIRFVVAKNGSKLIKVPGACGQQALSGTCSHRYSGAENSAMTTPKMAIIGGVKFYRSKNGNLYRHGIVKAQRYVSRDSPVGPLTSTPRRRSGAVKKVNVPCKVFSMTGNSFFFQKQGPRPSRDDWLSVSPRNPTDKTLGSCLQGPRCRYLHDPNKVAACKDFLLQGECASGDACDLSHDLCPERTPACLHFAKDNCTKPNCRYTHVKVSPGAPVCRSFGIYGYCEKGLSCPDRHAFECPDFSNNGVCKSKSCKLPHRERASALRKANTARDAAGDEEMEDLSSDEDEDSVDSDDVDSDEVDEFIGQDENGNFDIAGKDYIAL